MPRNGVRLLVLDVLLKYIAVFGIWTYFRTRLRPTGPGFVPPAPSFVPPAPSPMFLPASLCISIARRVPGAKSGGLATEIRATSYDTCSCLFALTAVCSPC